MRVIVQSATCTRTHAGTRFCKDCVVTTCTHDGNHGDLDIELHFMIMSEFENGPKYSEIDSFESTAMSTSDMPGWLAALAAFHALFERERTYSQRTWVQRSLGVPYVLRY